MESEEEGDKDAKHDSKDVGSHNEVSDFVVEATRLVDRPRNDWVRGWHDGPASRHTVEDHAHKELVIVEADAVCDPWTMMIHFENAPVALGAVVTAVRLCFVAPLADADASELLSFDWYHYRLRFGTGVHANISRLAAASFIAVRGLLPHKRSFGGQ